MRLPAGMEVVKAGPVMPDRAMESAPGEINTPWQIWYTRRRLVIGLDVACSPPGPWMHARSLHASVATLLRLPLIILTALSSARCRGAALVAGFIACVADIRCFPSADVSTSAAGLAPVIRQPGRKAGWQRTFGGDKALNPFKSAA